MNISKKTKNTLYFINLEKVASYKYFGIDIHYKFNSNYSIEKMINGGWTAYFGLENNCKSINLVMWDKKSSSLKLLLSMLSCMVVKYRG